jgi:hypothetical protein
LTASKPTISYGHGFCDDCTEVTAPNWDIYATVNMTMSAINVVNDDIFDILGTATGATPEGFYRNHTALALNTTAFKKVKVRYKIVGAGSKAHIRIRYNDGSTDDLVAAGTSATLKVLTITPSTAHGDVDYVELGVKDATGHLYVEFVLIYKADFTIPNTKYGQDFAFPGRIAYLEPIGASGDDAQILGNKSATVDMNCELDLGTWTRAGDVLNGQVFLDIEHNSKTEPFQWIDLGDQVCQFKVLLDMPNFQWTTGESEASHRIHLTFHEYRRAPANDETYIERFGLDL